MIKRFTDIIIAGIAAIIATPIIVLCAIAIKLESKGPIFFLQNRSAKGGGNFKIFKLRTMVSDAHKGPELTQKKDSRITRIGAILRRLSLDELPQVFNVLKGDMSIVGPRPELPSITQTYSPELRQVLNYKPGITGISQVNGRASLEIEEKVKMEVNYYKRAGFWSDLLIILKTPWAVITNKGNVM